MTVRVVIRRRFKSGNVSQASSMLVQARKNAMAHDGYISSESLSGCQDPNEILVLSTWRHLEDWQTYEASQARQDLENQFAEMMEGPSQSIAYQLGLQQT